MASTILLSFRKTSDSYTVNGDIGATAKDSCAKEVSAHFGSNAIIINNMAQSGREMLSSSLSTNYASSSASSDDELSTPRRYSGSTENSDKVFVPQDSPGSTGRSVRSDTASNNAAFVFDEEDVCNNNSSRNKNNNEQDNGMDHFQIKSGLTSPVVATRTSSASILATKTPDNCFVSLYINGKRCVVMLNANYFVYEPELTSSSTSNDRVSIKLEDIVSVWTCFCSTRVVRTRKVDMCSCLISDPGRRTLKIPMVDPSKRQRPFVVKIFFVSQDHKSGFKLEMLTMSTFEGWYKHDKPSLDANDSLILADIAYKIRDTLEVFDRPKRLLMFVNPYGGSKKGTKIFNSKIKPMLELARIDFTLVVTERADHAKDTILDPNTDLRDYDGIVCVGGDGMFGEVLNGVLIRTQRENQINYGSVDATLKRPSIKLGVIPAGSTDAIVYATCGHKDAINSILPILLGRQINIDVGAVHHRDEEKLIRYTASFVGYGFFGDTIVESERNRWMGPKRYDWAGIKRLFKHRLYSGEIKLCIEPSDGSPKDHNPCGINCATCQKSGLKSREKLSAEDSPACISIRGRFLAINSAIVSCRCGLSKYGMSPMAHVGNGCTDLILVSKCSRLNYLRYLISVAFSTKSPFDFDFVDAYRVREFEFNPIIEPHKRKGYMFEKSIDCDFFEAFDENDPDSSGSSSASSSRGAMSSLSSTTGHMQKRYSQSQVRRSGYSLSSSVWNCDGEVINDTAIHVKIHCQLVTIYAPGFDVERLISKDRSLVDKSTEA